MLIRIFFFSAICLIKARLLLHKVFTETSLNCSSSLPDSILDKSRMSLISSSKCLPLRSIVAIAFVCRSLLEPNTPSKKPSDMPRIAFRGVRSSWLMFAKNSSLRRVARASSALMLASCSFVCFSCSSACLRTVVSLTRTKFKLRPATVIGLTAMLPQKMLPC